MKSLFDYVVIPLVSVGAFEKILNYMSFLHDLCRWYLLEGRSTDGAIEDIGGTCLREFLFFFEGKPTWWCILIWSNCNSNIMMGINLTYHEFVYGITRLIVRLV